MQYIYLISTKEHAEKNEYRIGSTTRTFKELISEYSTFFINPVVYLYMNVTDCKLIKFKSKKKLKKYIMRKENGSSTNWIKLELVNIIATISNLVDDNVK